MTKTLYASKDYAWGIVYHDGRPTIDWTDTSAYYYGRLCFGLLEAQKLNHAVTELDMGNPMGLYVWTGSRWIRDHADALAQLAAEHGRQAISAGAY